MLRRIVSLGHTASESDEPMSRSTEDATQSPDSARSTGGLASVFKNLTGARLTKSPPPVQPMPICAAASTAQLTTESATVQECTVTGQPAHRLDALEHLRSAPLNERIAAAASLRIAIATCSLTSVLDIWYAGKDLIEPGKPHAARVAGWELVTECVRHHECTDLERREYFRTISAPANPEDFHLQLAALEDLTSRGRDLAGFEYDVVPLLSTWLQEKFQAVKEAKEAVKEARKNPSRSTSRATKAKANVSGEEKNFSRLFDFVQEVVKFNFKVTNDNSAGGLIECLLDICMATNSEDDLKSCINVFNAIVTFGMIPSANLGRCVNVLSSIYSMVANLAKPAWQVLSNISKSHHGNAMVQILLTVLQAYTAAGRAESQQRDQREVRGALEVLQKLVWKSSNKGYPSVPLSPLIDGLVNLVKNQATPKTCGILLQLINSLFDDGAKKLNAAIEDEDWAVILNVAADCAKRCRVLPKPDKSSGRDVPVSGRSLSSPTSSFEREDPILAEIGRLAARLEQLLLEFQSELVQRQDCIVFFTKIHELLPDSAAGLVLDYFAEFHCCFPSDIQWEDNVSLVLETFFRDRRRSISVRSRAFRIITEVIDILEIIDAESGVYTAPGLTQSLLDGIAEESETQILQNIVSFAVSVSQSADQDLFDHIIDCLRSVVANDRSRAPHVLAPVMNTGSQTQPPESADDHGNFQSQSNVVTRGYVQMFMRSMDTDVRKASRLFDAIVHIARSSKCETDARLTAMKMLFRLRSDWENHVFLTPFTESDALATMMFRTEESISKRLTEEAQNARPPRPEANSLTNRPGRAVSFGQSISPFERDRTPVSRSTSGAGAGSASAGKYRQMWSLSDQDALPEPPSPIASPVLFSHCPIAPDEVPEPVPALNMAAWLEALISILHVGCDWEIYSFIIVHLPSQLANHALFEDAIPQVQQIRGIICEKIRNNMFQEPPISTHLRKTEVAVCFYHILTTILSYHHHFQKNEEDEIVQTFMQGLSDKSAKCCIHALSICAHELPLSTSKCLVAILQRMSQIITRQGVAMHILEFLACLSRLSELYSNFREDEYRIVFGICFRYLQDVRAKRSSLRLGNGSEPPTPMTPLGQLDAGNTSDDLPQYVYALGYHVITFWFLAVKLPDRPNHVPWIAKNLFADADGGPGEEQAQITLDFMSRVAYSDVDESLEDPLFTQERFDEIKERNWIVGNSIVSIKQATRNGWAHVTKRQPSGTSCFVVRESIKPLPHHQIRAVTAESNRDGQTMLENAAFPSHVMVQLLSSLPQPQNSTLRPIPLPEDPAIPRAIKMFDHNSPVDGHKVGVIYIGEGQSKEAEILANVSGSRDYIDFLNGLGTLTKLKGATFNAQGLDRQYDTDGQYTFCWRDRVTEIVFHVTTQMPTNLDQDPACTQKKKHIGNDFVNIIFNDSGLPFNFDTFASEFNYVNIVITPVSRASFVASRERAAKMAVAKEGGTTGETDNGKSYQQYNPFFKVQVMSKPGFPEISPAASTKMISLESLPDFIRLLALNASVFSHVWSTRTIGEHVSTWRNRLREIVRMRERYGPKPTAPSPSPPPTASTGGGGGGGFGGVSSVPTISSISSSQHTVGNIASSSTSTLDASRPASSMRDSFSSLRRSSVATFFTTASEQTQQSHRSSMMSSAPTHEGVDMTPTQSNGHDPLADSLDFSKWA